MEWLSQSWEAAGSRCPSWDGVFAPAQGYPRLLHPPWPVTFTFPTFPGAWASLEAALAFDVTPNRYNRDFLVLVSRMAEIWASRQASAGMGRSSDCWGGLTGEQSSAGRAGLQRGCCAAGAAEGGSFVWGDALWHGCPLPASSSTPLEAEVGLYTALEVRHGHSQSILPAPGQQDPPARHSVLPGLSPSPRPTCGQGRDSDGARSTAPSQRSLPPPEHPGPPPGTQQLHCFAPVTPNLDQLCQPWFK